MYFEKEMVLEVIPFVNNFSVENTESYGQIYIYIKRKWLIDSSVLPGYADFLPPLIANPP